jgi:hypothetical protein
MLWKVFPKKFIVCISSAPMDVLVGFFRTSIQLCFFFSFFFGGESCISSFYSLELFCVCRLDIVFIHLIFLCLEGRVKWYIGIFMCDDHLLMIIYSYAFDFNHCSNKY